MARYHQEEPEGLVKMQAETWDPLIAWVNEKFGTDITKTYGLLQHKQSESTIERMRQHLKSLTPMQLAGFERAVLTAKSFIIPICLTEDHLTVEAAAKAARLEVDHQILRWGEVEDAHDVDLAIVKRDLAASLLAYISE
ncbi:ATP synthase complex assembly protein atp12 [Phlyctochytrium bullatum]|nr:ATP synthase complex assembly protein atp12 [Phlyctochytrium bullatum]